jgi:Tfp pilus assembly protein PilV
LTDHCCRITVKLELSKNKKDIEMYLFKNQRGFAVVEAVLAVLLVAAIGSTGYFAYKAHQNKSTPVAATSSIKSTASTSSTSSTATPTPSLADAVTVAQTAFNEYASQANTSNGLQGMDFINAHKTWFTTNFINTASANGSSTSGNYLICYNGSAFLDSVTVSGGSLAGQTATVSASESVQGTAGAYVLPVTLKVVSGAWAIDSIDFSSCGS